MYFTEDQYYTINKPVLKALGIWPYDRSCIVILQRVLIVLILYSHLFAQLSVFVTTEYNMALFLRVTSVVFPLSTMIVQYCFFMFISKNIKNIHYQIRHDWKLLRNKMELEIMERNAQYGQFLIRLLFLLLGFVCISIVVLQFLPEIFDIVWPLNEPRPRYLIVMVEYFVPPNKYFYIKVLHELLIIQLGWIIGCATHSQILGFIFHSFGMFKLARHRIQSVEKCVWHIPFSNIDRVICNEITHIAIAHHRAVKFTVDLIMSLNILYCITTIIIVLALITDLYGIFEAITISRDIKVLIQCFVFGIGLLVILFVAVCIGEKLTDYNREVATHIYNTSWYLMPISSQKLILFLIQNTGKEFTIVVGSILEAKMESFVMIVKVAMSYVTVLYNMYNG